MKVQVFFLDEMDEEGANVVDILDFVGQCHGMFPPAGVLLSSTVSLLGKPEKLPFRQSKLFVKSKIESTFPSSRYVKNLRKLPQIRQRTAIANERKLGKQNGYTRKD